jgi:hypothetical protein
MAFTFPAAPTVGQVYTSGTVSWQWDGVAWRGTGTSGINLLRTDQSGSISGSLTMGGSVIGVTGPTTSFNGGTCISTDYNYVISGSNDTGNKLVCFVNGSARSADGGTNGVTLRNDGGTLTLGGTSVNVSAPLSPTATNTYDLGTSSLRWRNIYTQDLQLSNGIGDYTVVEGEEDLFLYNNKTGKTFKFALIEVDPSTVPPKTNTD